MEKKYFTSHDLSFVAAAILTGKVGIARVTFDNERDWSKVYHLSPAEKVHELHLQYISDQLKVSPAQLSAKIASIKNLQAEKIVERNI
jgi:hypothetical protein